MPGELVDQSAVPRDRTRKSFLARDLLRIEPCEFLLQVAAQRRINSRVQFDQGLDFRWSYENWAAIKAESTFQCYPRNSSECPWLVARGVRTHRLQDSG